MCFTKKTATTLFCSLCKPTPVFLKKNVSYHDMDASKKQFAEIAFKKGSKNSI